MDHIEFEGKVYIKGTDAYNKFLMKIKNEKERLDDIKRKKKREKDEVKERIKKEELIKKKEEQEENYLCSKLLKEHLAEKEKQENLSKIQEIENKIKFEKIAFNLFDKVKLSIPRDENNVYHNNMAYVFICDEINKKQEYTEILKDNLYDYRICTKFNRRNNIWPINEIHNHKFKFSNNEYTVGHRIDPNKKTTYFYFYRDKW